MQLQHGYYVYVGSALGPGGLRARIAHHQKLSTRPHWHIDYLRAHAQIKCIWFSYDVRRREHQWAGVMGTVSRAKIPLRGFGASDCNCQSHLYFLQHCHRGSVSSGALLSNTLAWRSSSLTCPNEGRKGDDMRLQTPSRSHTIRQWTLNNPGSG